MAARAIVISIANYANDQAFGKTLPGAAESAQEFADWLVLSQRVANSEIVRLRDPHRLELEKAFRDLVDNGQNATERLFVFFSGHGISFQDVPGHQRPADVLITSEFETLQDSGHSCLKLGDLQDKLFNCLGAGEHFYFVDACRNMANAADVNPTNISWVRSQGNGTPTIFTMFSVERLSPAVDNKQFAAQLVEGLSGKGKAKKFNGARLLVTFDSVGDYLRDVRSRPIEFGRNAGSGPGEILEIIPVRQYQCKVEVINASVADHFTLTIENAKQQLIGAPRSFVGSSTVFKQPPDDYYLGLQHPTDVVVPVTDNHADLWEDCSIQFKMSAGVLKAIHPVVAQAIVSLTTAPSTTLEIENLQTGDTVISDRAFEGTLAPGEYFVRMKTAEGRTLRRRRFAVAAGGHEVIDVARRRSSAVRDGLLAVIPGAHDSAQIDFSETLGPMADDDLGLWLSIIGASRIVGAPGEFSKLKNLELPSFENVTPGGSAAFLLLGLEEAPPVVEVSVTVSAINPEWQTFTTQRTPNMPGIFAWHLLASPGQRFISVRLAGKAVLTFASYMLPNRVTLFTLAQDEQRGLSVHQYLLPIRHLVPWLTPDEQLFFDGPPLRNVRFIAVAQKQLAEIRRLPRPTTDPELINRWHELLDGKWLDPVMGIMACYELQRSGEPLEPIVMSNLQRYFSQLPDVAAIRARVGMSANPPDAVPMFLTGVRTFPELQLPLAKGKLDFSGPWTSWIGAIR